MLIKSPPLYKKRISLSERAEASGFVKVVSEGKYAPQITMKKGDIEIVVCNNCGGGYVAVKQEDGKFKKYHRQDAVNFLKQSNEKVEKEKE